MVLTEAVIKSIIQATPTVKVLRLQPKSKISFKAGQWLDCYLDLVEGRAVAGYTMTSSPIENMVELAVKYSETNPVTMFIHCSVKTGDVLWIDGGKGDTYFEKGMAESLFLIAGGIGITPIMSIIRYLADSTPDVKARLLYSARTSAELLYRPQIDEISRSGQVTVFYTVTREQWSGRRGRIDASMIEEAGVEPDALHYICGPRGMIQEMVRILSSLGIRRNHMKYEIWW